MTSWLSLENVCILECLFIHLKIIIQNSVESSASTFNRPSTFVKQYLQRQTFEIPYKLQWRSRNHVITHFISHLFSSFLCLQRHTFERHTNCNDEVVTSSCTFYLSSFFFLSFDVTTGHVQKKNCFQKCFWISQEILRAQWVGHATKIIITVTLIHYY